MKAAFNPRAREYGWLYDCLIKQGGADDHSVAEVIRVLNELQLPVPSWPDEFISATKGLITMTNKYGVVIRIEDSAPERVKNPWVIQPIGTFEAGRIIIEIIPATRNGKDEFTSRTVAKQLLKSEIDFFDQGSSNIGLLPVKSTVFSKGIPVVIDRLAVRTLEKSNYTLSQIFNDMGVKADPQEIYKPLRDALQAAWPDKNGKANPALMQKFWILCGDFVTGKTLVSGWKEDRDDWNKLIEARNSATNYDQLIMEFRA